jgi:hypothetical protein
MNEYEKNIENGSAPMNMMEWLMLEIICEDMIAGNCTDQDVKSMKSLLVEIEHFYRDDEEKLERIRTILGVKTNDTCWDRIKNFVNEAKIGDVLKRKDLLIACKHDGFSSTPDNYRNYLCATGYLEVAGRGRYKKKKDVDSTMTTSELYSLYERRNVRM